MRIVFVGCRHIGKEALRYLLERHRNEIVSAYTLDKSLERETAYFEDFDDLGTCGMKIHQVRNINSTDTMDSIRNDAPDLMITVGWSQLIRKELIELPPLGCVGFHSSLLPDYRGGSPVNWGLINGETRWGVTIFYIAPGADTGDIIGQWPFDIELSDTCKTVYDKATLGVIELLKENLPKLSNRSAPRIKQNLSAGRVFRRRKPQDGLIDWTKRSIDIYNWIRALTHPYPGAFTYYEGRKLFIWAAGPPKQTPYELGTNPGTIVQTGGKNIKVRTGDGVIELTEYDFYVKSSEGRLVRPYTYRPSFRIGEVFGDK